MNDTRVNTIRAPRIPGTPDAGTPNRASPACLVSQAKQDCVVRIRNNGFASYILVAYDAAALQTFPATADVFKIPAGAEDEFVVAKEQSLLISTPSGGVDGAGVEVSYQVFQAYPTDSAVRRQP